MALRLRRGTNAERLTITPEIGELIYTTDTKKVFVGDGATAGGVPIDTGLLDLAGNSLNDLGDVATTAPTDTQVLAWNDANSNWEPADAATPDLSTSVISDLSDVGIGVINDGQVLVWNDTASQFQPGDVLGLTTELSDLTDVADQAPNDTQVLAWNATSLNWEPTDAATPDLTSAVISDLGNVAISVINSGQILVWDGANFVPGDAGGDVVSDTTPELGGNLDAGGFNITNANAIGAISINATNFTGNFIGTHSGDFNGDFDGNFVGSIYNEDSAIVFDAETNTLNNLVSATATEFVGDLTGDVTGNVLGNVTGGVVGDVVGSVFSDNSTLLLDGIDGNVFGTIKGELETENVINTMYATDQNSILKMYKHGGSFATPTEPSNFARVGISLGSYNTAAADFIDEAIMFSYHQTAGGGFLALSPVAQDNVTFFETSLELDGNAGKMIVAAPNGATFNGSITPGVYADTAARDAAIAAPTAGMMVFVTALSQFQGYDGSAWVALN